MPTHVSTGQITIADVMDGAQGPAVVVTCNRAPSFLSTDGVLNSGQPQIDFTATVEGLAGATYAWAFAGLQTNPVASTTATQVVTAAQFGTSSAATVTCTVTSGGKTYSGQVSIYRVEKSTAEAGATVGATLGHVTVNATLFTTDFANTTGWTNLNGSGEWAAVSNSGSINGNALQIGNLSGDDQAWLGRTSLTIPFNPTKMYRIRSRVYAFGGTTGQFFMGFEAFKGDGTTVIAKTGQEYTGTNARTSALAHWVAASERVLPQDEWVEIEAYVKGHGGAGSGELSPNPATPVTMRTGTAYISPAIAANWPNKSGAVLVDYIIVEEVTYTSPNTQGKITPANASTWIADAAIGNAQIANAAVDTLTIKGNAVTVPITARYANTIPGSGSSARVAEATITLDAPGYVYAIFTANQTYGTGVRISNTVLQMGGQSITVGGEAVTTNICVSDAAYFPAGTHIISVDWMGQDSGVNLQQRTLFVMGVKR